MTACDGVLAQGQLVKWPPLPSMPLPEVGDFSNLSMSKEVVDPPTCGKWSVAAAR